MTKKSYTNKQRRNIQKNIRVPVTGKTIFHKSAKDWDRRQDNEAIQLELDDLDLDLEGTNEETEIREG